MKHDYMEGVKTQNKYGEWVPAIPEPYARRFRYICQCDKGFWSDEEYRGHYAFKHILGL